MVSQNPKISVLTSCYNATRYIREAIESILSQTYGNFEFILIDDGSTDETLSIIKAYAQLDNRIVVLEKKNTGISDSLNIGLNIANGEWIARLDADDIAFPDRLEKQLNYVEINKDVVLLGTGCITIDENGKEIRKYVYPKKHRSIMAWMEAFKSPFPHSSAFFNKEIVQELGGYNNTLNGAEDIDLWLRIGLSGNVSCLREPLIKLRKHSDSITHNNEMLIVLSHAALLCHYLRNAGYPDPAASENANDWDVFIKWVECHLEKTSVLNRFKAWEEARTDYFATKNRLIRALRFGTRIVRTGHARAAVWEKLFGYFLPQRLAREWMNRCDAQ